MYYLHVCSKNKGPDQLQGYCFTLTLLILLLCENTLTTKGCTIDQLTVDQKVQKQLEHWVVLSTP